jgi:hypothetical protein
VIGGHMKRPRFSLSFELSDYFRNYSAALVEGGAKVPQGGRVIHGISPMADDSQEVVRRVENFENRVEFLHSRDPD